MNHLAGKPLGAYRFIFFPRPNWPADSPAKKILIIFSRFVISGTVVFAVKTTPLKQCSENFGFDTKFFRKSFNVVRNTPT